MKKAHESGFTLVEIMIVVTIIGFLAGLAIPAITRSRRASQATRCVVNMRQIESAKEQWAMETFGDIGSPCNSADIAPYLKGGVPDCPANGSYRINPVGSNVTCSISGDHALKN